MKQPITNDYEIRPIEPIQPIGEPSVITEETDLDSLNDIVNLDGSCSIFKEENVNDAKKMLIKGTIGVGAASLIALTGNPLKGVINSILAL